LPTERTVRGWKERAPQGFRYAVKGSRFITHVKRLAGTAAPVRRFHGRVKPLGRCLAAVLWQLPPTLQCDLELLEAFLAELPGGTRHAVEFRHESWARDEVLEVLRKHGAAVVAVSSRQMPKLLETTADFVYVRFHGLGGGYRHDYTKRELRPFVRYLREAAAGGRDGFAYFNNDAAARAPKNALELIELLGDAAS
jgi:uncharacterized protein YecE (DUF72 family)